jgi:hypothetical protein
VGGNLSRRFFRRLYDDGMTILKTGLLAGALVMALGGCGGDDNKGGGTCGAFTPCGGNVVGTWDVKDICVQGKVAIDGCPTATTNFDDIHGTGSMTFNPDMTGTGTITLSGSMKVTVPRSCAAGVSCSVVELGVRAQLLSDPNGLFTGVTCTGDDPCTCALALKNTPMTDSGPYSTAGTVLTQGTDQSDYCVAGNEMKVKPHAALTMPAPMVATEDLNIAVTLTKK